MSKALQEGLQIDAIIVSPLTRAIETAKLGLACVWDTVPVIAVEMTRESFGKNKCDRRRTIAELRREFPRVDFDRFMVDSEEDPWWTPEREPKKTRSRRG